MGADGVTPRAPKSPFKSWSHHLVTLGDRFPSLCLGFLSLKWCRNRKSNKEPTPHGAGGAQQHPTGGKHTCQCSWIVNPPSRVVVFVVLCFVLFCFCPQPLF